MPSKQSKNYTQDIVESAKKALDSVVSKFNKQKPEQLSVTVTTPQEQEFSKYSKGLGYRIPKNATPEEIQAITNRLLQTERKKTLMEEINEQERIKYQTLQPTAINQNKQVVDVRLVLNAGKK